MKRILLAAAAALSLGMAPAPQIFSESRPLMHTLWDFRVVARSQAEARAAVEAAAAEVERLDQALAMWREDSELHAFNAKTGQGPQAVSPDLDRVFSLGQAVSELSQGASDCTVGPLVQLWYEHLQKDRLPTDAQVHEALKHLNYRELTRGADGRWSAPAGTIVDLGSLAKGYAQDRAALILEARGLHAYLLNAGGQVYARGLKPGGQAWRVGIVHPRHEERMVCILSLSDQALSTSGDYEQSRLVQGRRYHHIIDPRTGRPTTNGTCSVSVLIPLKGAPDPGAGSWCDALDTAAMVLGQQAGKELLDRQKVAALLLKEDSPGHLVADKSALWDPAVDVVLNEP
jgi:thiamine biosynthesis lipoprotein